MTLKEAMWQRHTVRKYEDRVLSIEHTQLIEARIDELNQKYGLKLKLVLNNKLALNTFIKLFLSKGVSNYIVLSADNVNDSAEALGHCGADIMLYAQTLGLNTWWVGGTFSRKNVARVVGSLGMLGIIVIGYGIEQGKAHISKTVEEVSEYKGEAPGWFNEGVKAALLAPTALNRQAFHVEGEDNRVSIRYDKGMCDKENLGIIKYHFELGAGSDNFIWN
jgi:nitroreductase